MASPFSGLNLTWAPDAPEFEGRQQWSSGTVEAIEAFFGSGPACADDLIKLLVRGVPGQVTLEVAAQRIMRSDGDSPIPYLQLEVLGLVSRPVLKILFGFYRIDGVLILEAGLIQLDERVQGQGLGRALVCNLADLADALSVSAIQFQAGMSVGGYAWARFGGVPVFPAAFTAMLKDRLVRMEMATLSGESHAAAVRLGEMLDMDSEVFIERLPRLLRASNAMAKLLRSCLLGSEWMGYWEPGNPRHRQQLAEALRIRTPGT